MFTVTETPERKRTITRLKKSHLKKKFWTGEGCDTRTFKGHSVKGRRITACLSSIKEKEVPGKRPDIMQRKVFFVDICNTLADVNGQLNLRGFQTSVYPSPIPPEVFTEELFREAAPIWPVVNLVKRLARNYSIVYLTARPEKVRKVTLDWLERYSLPAGPVIHTNGRLKSEIALDLVPLNWIAGAIEDSPQEIAGYAKSIPGIKLLVPDWPHNEGNVGLRISPLIKAVAC